MTDHYRHLSAIEDPKRRRRAVDLARKRDVRGGDVAAFVRDFLKDPSAADTTPTLYEATATLTRSVEAKFRKVRLALPDEPDADDAHLKAARDGAWAVMDELWGMLARLDPLAVAVFKQSGSAAREPQKVLHLLPAHVDEPQSTEAPVQ